MQSLNVKSSAVNQLNVDELEGIAQVEFTNGKTRKQVSGQLVLHKLVLMQEMHLLNLEHIIQILLMTILYIQSSQKVH